MKKSEGYERFPLWMVLLSNLLSIAIYSIGLYIFLQFGILFAILFIVYVLWTEIRLLEKSCRHCYYYDKTCAFGKGRCCALFFKKGDPKKFIKTKITVMDILPDFLVFILPLIGGIVLVFYSFSWSTVTLLVILVVLGFGGNAIIRGSFACKHCKQRGIGCPAEKLFAEKR